MAYLWCPNRTRVNVVRESGLAEQSKLSGNGNRPPLSEEFVTRVAGAQRPLFAYIRSLVGPWAEPEDILQEVNLVLCRKADEYDGRARFLTWACGVAYFQVLAHLKQHRREKCVYVDEGLLSALADPLTTKVEDLDDRLEALRKCIFPVAALAASDDHDSLLQRRVGATSCRRRRKTRGVDPRRAPPDSATFARVRRANPEG